MGRRSQRGFWWAVLLIGAVGYFSRGRTDTAEKPEPDNPAPRVAERPIQISKPSQSFAKPELSRDLPEASRDNRKLHLRVVGVHDGDTITGLDEAKTQHKIRLDAIDAPELGQPFGQAAKKALSGKVFGKDVVVIVKTRDKYGRTVGHVLVDGRDVNLEMLEEGMAWHYVKYDKNKRLAEAEEQARVAKRGLWQDREPVPPWDWRKGDKQRKAAVKQ